MSLLLQALHNMSADRTLTTAQRYQLLEDARREIFKATSVILINSQPDYANWQDLTKTPGARFADGSSLPEGTL